MNLEIKLKIMTKSHQTKDTKKREHVKIQQKDTSSENKKGQIFLESSKTA